MTRHLFTIWDLSREEIEHLLARGPGNSRPCITGARSHAPDRENPGHHFRRAPHPHPGLL